MSYEFIRTEMLLGREALDKLRESTVAVFGIGGVGSYVVEALARSAVGSLVLVDKDDIDITNINRQIPATHETIGMPKVEVMKERVLKINADAKIYTKKDFYTPAKAEEFFFCHYDYIVDAVDNVTAKIDLIVQAQKRGIPIISSMGTGNKLDPMKFKVADIYETSVDPLARVLRRELRKRDISQLKVVFSEEPPVSTDYIRAEGKRAPGSVSFVPSVAGLIIAGEVIKDLIGR